MTLVLRADVASDQRKARLSEAGANVTAWAGSVDVAELFVSAITVLEWELGVLLIERRAPHRGQRCNRRWSSRCYLGSPDAPCSSTRR